MTALGAVEALQTPSFDYQLLAPMLIVFGGAIVGVLVEAFVHRNQRRRVQIVLSLATLIAALLVLVLWTRDGVGSLAAAGTLAIDGPALFLQGTIVVLSLVAFLLFAEQEIDSAGDAFTSSAASIPGSATERELTAARVAQTEVWPLALFSVGGMMLFVAADDLLTFFVALEVMSLPLYLLVGLARRRRLLSQEAALKYFLLGSFSSAFLLFGSAFLFGYAGTISFSGIFDALATPGGLEPLLVIGAGLAAIGLFFKVGAVPFHSWVPDVYQGAPTPVTAFMASATKVAAFGAMLRLFYVALGDYQWNWRPLFWAVVIATIVVGSILAITQTDIKRMLAYSSVAQVGFILTGVTAASRTGLSSTMFYLVVYGFATIGAFALVTVVRDGSAEATHLSRWAGLGRRAPLVAAVMSLFLLSFAGIPLTAGFIGKFLVFDAAIDGDAWPLVVVGAVFSAVAAFFYVRVIVLMYFSDPPEDAPTVAVPSVSTSLTIAIAATATIVLGLVPGPLIDLAQEAAVFIR
jgi:NADH-quinone oxidoreductase subunit N